MLDQLKVRIVEAIHTSRKKSAKPILYNLVNNLDKCVEEYN